MAAVLYRTISLLDAIFRALSPVEKWEALRTWSFGLSGANWLWVILLASIVLMMGLGVVSVILTERSAAKRRTGWDAFYYQLARLALTDQERDLLISIVRHAKLRGPALIFGSLEGFERGCVAFMDNPQAKAFSEQVRERTKGLAQSLREKLGFVPVEGGPATASSQNQGVLELGSEVSVVHRGEAENLRAKISSVAGTEISLQAHGVTCRPGEVWLMRYSVAQAAWELRATVVKQAEELIVLRRLDTPRFINRRRFLRISTDRPAQVARFPFHTEQGPAQTPDFVPARLVEVAGPGLRLAGLALEDALTVRTGEKILVVLQLQPGKAIEGQARVRRVITPPKGRVIIAAELTGLSEAETAELVRFTQAVALEQQSEPEGEPVANGPVLLSRVS